MKIVFFIARSLWRLQCVLCRINGSFTLSWFWCSRGWSRWSICKLLLIVTMTPPTLCSTRPSGFLINCSAWSRGCWSSSARYISVNAHNICVCASLHAGFSTDAGWRDVLIRHRTHAGSIRWTISRGAGVCPQGLQPSHLLQEGRPQDGDLP